AFDNMVGSNDRVAVDSGAGSGVQSVDVKPAERAHYGLADDSGAASARANVTVTSNVASADALERITPASAVRVIPNDAPTSLISQFVGGLSCARLSATVLEPATIASLILSRRSSSCWTRFEPHPISRPASTGTT